jgi:putative aminopeptidase FrvX
MKREQILFDDIAWLKDYIENAAPSGNEVSGQKMWLERIKPWVDEHIVDAYGNVVAIVNPKATFKVVVEAHADEIAWYVHTITKDGFLHVEKNGGSDAGVAPSQRVRIHTRTGIVHGIFGWPAIHTRVSSPKQPKPENIFVDCGCFSKEQVEKLGIQVGDCITYDSGLSVMNDDFFVGRALDNKLGGFILTALARMIHEQQLKRDYGLYLVNSVQEEVGLHGAGMIAHRVRPDCAFVIDATHATHTPLINRNKEGDIELGKGPVITKAPPIHNNMRELLVDTAKQEGIPYQLSVSSKKTGTDADAFAYSHNGIPTALVSLPLRYMHTSVETANKHDVENAIRLLYVVLSNLSPTYQFKYL